MTKSYQSSNLIQGSKHVTGHRSENSVMSEKKSTSKSVYSIFLQKQRFCTE